MKKRIIWAGLVLVPWDSIGRVIGHAFGLEHPEIQWITIPTLFARLILIGIFLYSYKNILKHSKVD